MDSRRWERIQAVFHEAVELPKTEREACLDLAAASESEVAAEVRIMLEADGRSASLLDRGLPQVAHQLLGGALDPAAFQEFGPYRIKKMLGEGGMGVVWLAERQDTRHQVAIKFLPHAALSPARRESFAREIRALARQKHRFIARLYDAGTLDDGTPWFAMEYVEGGPLSGYLKEHRLSVLEKLKLFRSICDAVQYAHGQEIIHRDLKPSNVLVEDDGTPRLLDFGIARQLQQLDEPTDRTRAQLRFGSRDYSAPEWLDDGVAGFYTDVYSLGVILHEMLTGRLPGPGNPASGDLGVVCLKAMHKDPAQRYRSVEALIRDIDHFLKCEPLEARLDSIPYRFRKFVSRNRRAVLAASLAFALTTGLVVFFTVRLKQERDRANHETAIETTMNRFLSEDLIGRTDPFRSGNAAESLADAVKEASPRIDLQFRSEPLIAARLHQTLASAFDKRSDFPQARKEYDQADRLFRQAEGSLSQDAVVVRLQSAAMEARSFGEGSAQRAKSILAGAEATLSKIATPRGDVAVWLHLARGWIAVVGGDARTSERNFSAALQAAEASPAFDETSRAKIEQTIAVSYIHKGNGAKAEPLLRGIVAALSKHGSDSPDVLRARIYLAQSLMTQGKYSEAVKEANQIYPSLLQKVGEDNETVLALLGTRAASAGYLGMYDDAIRDDLTVYRIAVRKHGPATLFSISTLSDAALSQCIAGRYGEGEPNARKAFEQSSKAFGPHSGLTGGTAYALAYCLTRTDKLNEASVLLRNIDVKATAELASDPKVGSSIQLLQAEIAARGGNYATAKNDFHAAATILDRPNASASDKADINRLRTMISAHPL